MARISTHATPTRTLPWRPTHAIQALAEPSLWTNAEVDRSDSRTSPWYSPHRQTPPALPPRQVPGHPSQRGAQAVQAVVHGVFARNAATGGYNFQINFQFRSRTFFIPAVRDIIKDHYEDTGYRIASFERKSVVVNDPTLNIPRNKDVSELTVQHEGSAPVLLGLGQESEDQEPVARCVAPMDKRVIIDADNRSRARASRTKSLTLVHQSETDGNR